MTGLCSQLNAIMCVNSMYCKCSMDISLLSLYFFLPPFFSSFFGHKYLLFLKNRLVLFSSKLKDIFPLYYFHCSLVNKKFSTKFCAPFPQQSLRILCPLVSLTFVSCFWLVLNILAYLHLSFYCKLSYILFQSRQLAKSMYKCDFGIPVFW